MLGKTASQSLAALAELLEQPVVEAETPPTNLWAEAAALGRAAQDLLPRDVPEGRPGSDELLARMRELVTDALPAPDRLRPGETWDGRDQAVLDAAQRVDPSLLFTAAVRLLKTLERRLPGISGAELEGLLREARAFEGLRVRVGTPGSDVFEEEADVFIDPGGDDVYRGAALQARPGGVSLIIDLGGNDRYLAKGFGSMGSGMFGAGILVDIEGNDAYLADDGAQGAAIFGVGLLWDLAGDDLYQGRAFSQGTGLFGIGLLIDDAGTDLYRASYLSQGMGHVKGAGLLRDALGNDLYSSGFSQPDPRGYSEKYGNTAQGEVFQSLSQGFGMGWRGFAGGGIGMLLDGRGNDRYLADYFGQGAAYWFSWGLLYDGGGNDSYVARRYAQGAGVHFAVGTLLDAYGNDRYQSWAVSMGCGHDYGVGLLWDGRGDDYYLGDWTVLGMSNAMGVGILRDQGGSDHYTFWDGAGATSYWDDLRHGAGIGLFLDSGDKPDYFTVKRDTRAFNESWWSAGMSGRQAMSWGLGPESSKEHPDEGRVYVEQSEKEGRFLSARLSRSAYLGDTTHVSELLSIAAGWGLNGSVPMQAKRMLLGADIRKTVPILIEMLDTPSVFGVMNLEELFHGVPPVRKMLSLIAQDGSRSVKQRARALYFLGKLRQAAGVPVLQAALKDPEWELRAAAARGIGFILERELRKKTEAALVHLAFGEIDKLVEALQKMTKSQLMRVMSSVPGMTRDDWVSLAPGYERWNAPVETARAAAAVLLRAKPDLGRIFDDIEALAPQARSALIETLRDPHPEVRRWAVDSLGRSMDDYSGVDLAAALDDEDYAVREAAAQSLKGDANTVRLLRDLEKTGSARLRAQVMRVMGRLAKETFNADLLAALDDESPFVRLSALRSLDAYRRAGLWKPDRRVLERAAGDPDPWVRILAERSLEGEDGAR